MKETEIAVAKDGSWMKCASAFLIVIALACARDADHQDQQTSSTADRVETAEAVQPQLHEAPIQTDRDEYILREGQFGPETTIVSTFRAPADQAVYLANCNGAVGVGLQRKVNGKWENAWAGAMNACLSPPIELAPGAERIAEILIRAGAGGMFNEPSSSVVPSGVYRAVWFGVYSSYDVSRHNLGVELPVEQRVSLPFTISGN